MKKYKLPPTDERYLAYTWEELLLEFFEDLYENDRKQFASFQRPDENEEAVLTGDPVIDELERRLAAGEDIGMEDLEVLEQAVDTEPQLERIEEADEWDDDYSDLSAPRH